MNVAPKVLLIQC